MDTIYDINYKVVNMANDSVLMCLICMKLVPECSQAMQYDLCHRLAHIECVARITKAAYKLAGGISMVVP